MTLIEAVVAVIPDDRQAQATHRGEGGSACTHHNARGSEQHTQEGSVATSRAPLCGQHDNRFVKRGEQLLLQRRRHGLGLCRSRDYDESASARRQGGPDGIAEQRSPPAYQAGPSWESSPHGTWRAAVGERIHESGSAICVPSLSGRRLPLRRRRCATTTLRMLGRRMTRRYRKADDVRTHPGVSRRDRLDQRLRGTGEHRQVRDDPANRGQSTGVGRRRAALPDPSAHILPTEADDHARAHGGRGIKIRWDEVVEKAVQMRQGRIEQHSGHGRGNTIAVHTMLRRRRCSQ